MKKLLLLIILLVAYKSHATHVLGADLYYEQLSANQYKIILKMYRDCGGVALGTTQAVTLSNAGVAASLSSVTLTRQSVTILPNLCPSITNRCLSATGTYGIEEHLYTATVNFNPVWGSIDVRLSVCCHSNTITSMSAPGGENIFLTTTINRPTTSINTGPVFLNSPIYYTPTSASGNYTYSHLAFDPDGDSLAYSLEQTLEGFNNPVEYAAGYSGAVPFGAGTTTTINPNTGLMTITNVTTNRCATYVVVVREYRNGQLLSTSRREVSLMFRTPANGPQTISDFYSVSGNNISFGCASGIYNDTLLITDVDPTDLLNVTVTATSPFITIQPITPSNPAQVVVQYNLDSLVAGNFQLTINASDGRCPFPYTSSRTFNLSIGDSLPPSITCPGDTVLQKNASCNVVLPNFTTLANATDNCGVHSISQIPAPGTVITTNTTVYLIAKDYKNQRDTCSFQVTLVDLIPPTINCIGNISVNTPPSSCGATVTFANPAVSDNCGGAISVTQTAGLTSGSFFPIGTTTNTFSATDLSGNTSTCSFTITVVDNQPPTVSPLPTLTAECSVTPVAPTAVDNCSGIITGTTTTSFPITAQGTTNITWSFTDGAGNTQTATQDVVIQDLTPPTIVCPADITTFGTSASGAIVTYSAPVYSDNCGTPILTQTAGLPSGSTFPFGTTTNTFQVTDAVGQITTCSFTVTVNSVAPNITCPNNIVTINDLNACGATVSFAATESVGIPASVITYSHAPGSFFPVGTTVVTATANNGFGSSICTFDITVQDNTPPVAVCQPYTAILGASGNVTITAANVDAGSSDNCTITNLTVSPSSFNCSNIGPNNVTLTVTDQSGNITTCNTVVTVQDNTPPVAACQPYTAVLDASGNVTVTATNIDAGSSDNCTITNLTVSPSSFNCSNIGPNNVTLTVTDQSGNITTCNTVVTVQDNTPPVAVCQPYTAVLDASGNVTITAANIDAGSSDNCTITNLTVSPSSFNCSNIGPNNVTLTVTDQSGNITTCNTVVTVQDNIIPIFTSFPSAISLSSAAGLCGQIVTYPLPLFDDNCIATLTQTDGTGLTSGDVFPVGTTLQTYTLTDAAGLTKSQSFTITITDTENPVISNCPSNISAFSSTTSCGNNVNWITPTSSDNCSILSFTSSHNPGDFFNVGTTPVIYTALDSYGNSSTCSFNVSVVDNVAPVVPVLTNITEECSVTVIPPVTTDNCAGSVTGTTSDPLIYTSQGNYTITWLFDDGNGNTSTTTQTVIIDDVTPPAIPSITNITGECSATATIPSAVDNCSGIILGTTTDPLTYSTQGTHTITWSFDDGNGNISTQIQNVVIDDITPPTIIAPADTIVNSNNAGCTAINVLLTAPITGDNCAIASVTNDAPNPFPNGNTIVTWTATDIGGNSSTVQQLVTVTSNITGSLDTTVCVTYSAPDGAVYTSSGTYSATVINATGCDSVITINLTILNPTFSTLNVEACESYTAPDGVVYTSSGNYSAILTNSIGCDSIISIILNIHNLNLGVGVQGVGTELVASELNVDYQWYNCTSQEIIPGAVGQTYVPVLTAEYSVILSDGVCLDTSECVQITLDLFVPEVISPNSDGKNDVFEIVGIEDYPENHLTVYNRWGQVVYEAEGYKNEWDGTNISNGVIGTNELPVGTYFYVLDLGPSENNQVGQILKGYVYLTR